jgi:O-antigen ligase
LCLVTVSKSLPIALLLALPWWLGATSGPVAQLGAWLATGGVLGVFLFLQQFRAWPHSLIWAAAVSVAIGFVQYSGAAAVLSPWVSEAAAGEMVANLRQRNQFASLMAIGVLALVFSVHGKTLGPLGQARVWALALACSAVACMAFGNALSGSRTGLLQWLAILGMAWVWRRSWGAAIRWVLATAFVAYGLGVLLTPWLAEIVGHGNTGLMSRLADTGGSGRLALWSNVLELIAREPLLGHGWRSLAYAHYSSDFSSLRFTEMPDNAHNLPLHLAVELGLPVVLGFCGLVGWLIWKNKPWAETRPDRQLAWGVLLVIGIHSMLEYPLWYGPFFMTTVISIVILCGDLWQELQEKWLIAGMKYTQFALILGVRCFAALLLAGTAFVAFDYHRLSQIYLQPEERSSWYGADSLGAAKQSVLFQSHAKFAELQITPLTKESAPRVLELSSELVRWSPEPRIIEKLIESSVMMGLDDVAAFHLKRYRLNYPIAHAAWAKQAL